MPSSSPSEKNRLAQELEPTRVLESVRAMVRLRKLPLEAERDVEHALSRVPPESQFLFSWAVQDAGVPLGRASERLMSVFLFCAAVNLADDLADGDCDYLEPRTAPGVQFLLQALACLPLTRSDLTSAEMALISIALTRAASGQCLEVRGRTRSALEYLEVADLIAGAQYSAYFRILWGGTALFGEAERVGALIGRLALIYTDLASQDPRLLGLEPEEKFEVMRAGRLSLAELESHRHLVSVRRFVELVRTRLGL